MPNRLQLTYLVSIFCILTIAVNAQVVSFKNLKKPLSEITEFQGKKSDRDLLGVNLPQMKLLKELKLIGLRMGSVEIPETLQLPMLEVLHLERNKLEELPKWICSLTSLKELYLGSNDLLTLPECICKLTELKIISVWGNNIYNLPKCMNLMRNEIEFDMTGMQYNEREQEDFDFYFPTHKFKFSPPCDCEFEKPNLEQIGGE